MKKLIPAIIVTLIITLLLVGSNLDVEYGFSYKLQTINQFNTEWTTEWNGLDWSVREGTGRVLNTKTKLIQNDKPFYVSVDVWNINDQWLIYFSTKDTYMIRYATPTEIEKFRALQKFAIPGGDWYSIKRPK